MAIQTIARLQNRRGLYADLPTSLAEGEFGWCLDTRQLFIGNSNGYGANTEVLTAYSQNDELITTIYSANGINLSSAISRTLHAKLDDIASIKDFGAIGDGVTDDAPAINAAISELLKGYPASNNTAVSIFFPAGTYLINSTLLLYPYLSIIGDGNNGTTILAAPGTSMQYMLETVDSLGQTGANIGLNGAVLPTKVHIRDISINTNSQQISAVHSTRYTHIRYERVNVRGGWVSGNPAGTDSAFTCSSIGNAVFTHDLQLVDCDIQGFTNAVLMNDPVAYTTLSRCTLHQLYRGIVAGLTPAYNGPEYTTITQTKFYSISNYGIYVGDASSNPGVTSIGNTFKSVGTPTSVKSIYWGTASVLNGSMGDVFSTAPGVIDNGATNIIVDAQQTNLTGVSGTSGYSGYSGVFNSSSNASSATVIATGSTAARTLANRFADVVNVKDFGAVGDGVTDDTAAFTAAIASAISTASALRITAGTYLVDQLTIYRPADAQTFSIIGPDGPENTILRKRTQDGNPLIVVGSATATLFQDNIIVTGVQFRGGPTAQSACPAAVQSYDMVRSQFVNCIFSNAQVGMLSYGGISNSWIGCQFWNNVRGVVFDKFTSLAGGGYPNNNNLIDPGVYNNTSWGIYFNNGRVLNIDNLDIEGNGTAANAATGGLYVNNVNNEGAGAAPAIGVNIQGGWAESNAGDATMQFNSGVNNVSDFMFVANANATYDIHVVAGSYHLTSVAFATNKVANLKEESGTVVGSSITSCQDALVGNFFYTPSKTTWIGAANSGSGVLTPAVLMRSGAVPVVMSTANPMMLTGTATTNGSGNVVVTFPTAFTVAPIVMTQIVDASTTQVESVQTSAISTSGFTINATKMVSGSNTVSGLASVSIQWIAIGAT